MSINKKRCEQARSTSVSHAWYSPMHTRSSEASFQNMLALEAASRSCTIQQYQFPHKTVELIVNSPCGSRVTVVQFPEPCWNRYLAWKRERASTG